MDTCKTCRKEITPIQALLFQGCCSAEHSALLEKFDVKAFCKALIEVHLLKKQLRAESRKERLR